MKRAVVLFLFCAIVNIVWAARLHGPQDMLIKFVGANLRDVVRDFKKTDKIRQMSRDTAGFEIGFVIRNMEETYRRMVDIYNSSLTTGLGNWKARTTDYIILLKHVEMLHWVLYHLTNMVHEVEKKYKIMTAGMFETHVTFTTPTTTTTKRRRFRPKAVVDTTTKRPTQSWWPVEYGWEVNYEWR